jgi:hypothetical protein
VRATPANGLADRFVRTIRAECLDWLLILNEQHLTRVLDVFVDHYNGHRPHRALALAPPHPTRAPVVSATAADEARVARRDRLGGLTSTSWPRDQVSAPHRREFLSSITICGILTRCVRRSVRCPRSRHGSN